MDQLFRKILHTAPSFCVGFLLLSVSALADTASLPTDPTTASQAPQSQVVPSSQNMAPEPLIAPPSPEAPFPTTVSSQPPRPMPAPRHAHREKAHEVPAASNDAVSDAPAWKAEHDKAVRLARNGNNDAALPILTKLHRQHPDDVSLTRDYLVIMSWAGGHDADVIKTYKSLKSQDEPDFVLEAVGHSYRGLGEYTEAIATYKAGLKRTPKSEVYAVGIIRCETEAGYVENALRDADANLKEYGNRVEVLLAAADAADQYEQEFKAVAYYQEALKISPNNKEALAGLIRAEDKMGTPHLALEIADAHPGAISPAEYRHIKGDEAADLLRQGMFDAPTEAGRYTVTDKALAMLDHNIAEWSKDPDATSDVVRERLDRVIALRNRNMMQDAVLEYGRLSQEGVTIPPYVMSSVGDAYMYLHEPEKARDIYLEVLKTDPDNYEVRRQLFYAYVECDDFKNAYAVIDKLAAEQPYWVNIKGETTQQLNPRHLSTEIAAGEARLYAGQVPEANVRIMPIGMEAPNSPSTHEALGNLYMAHGWPRKALKEYELGNNLAGGNNISNQVGIAEANLALHNYQAAESLTNDLVAREPENLAVERTQRDMEIHNMYELRVTAGYAMEPMTTSNVIGGEGYGIDTILYSPPIGYNWRIFAGEGFSHQHEPNQEGNIDLSRSTVGAEYRQGPWIANFGPTLNEWNGNQRIGGEGDLTYAFNDQWTVAGSAESFSRDTPLRAINSGVTADLYNAHAVWRQDESQQIRFGGEVMPFSDGNVRTGVDADYSHNLYDIPDFNIDGLISTAESQNTADSNRLYYNPKTDFIALIGPKATEILYQRYTTVWRQSLSITPGAYWQQYYGDSAVLRMRYEQRVQFTDTFDVGAGVNFNRQSYDGVPENDVSFTLDLVDRF